MKKRLLLLIGLVFVMLILIVAAGCIPGEESTRKSSVSVKYKVEFGIPRGGLNSGYDVTCYFTNDPPEYIDVENRTILVTNYYFGGEGRCSGIYGPFESITIMAPFNGFIRVKSNGYSLTRY